SSSCYTALVPPSRSSMLEEGALDKETNHEPYPLSRRARRVRAGFKGRARGARAACALLSTAATACAANDGPSDPGSIDERADELSVTHPSFVTLRADLRRCLDPMCGGFFVRDVNQQGTEQYVSRLDFQESGLPTD